MIHKLHKNSLMSIIGMEGRQDTIKMRMMGETYQSIVDYLNKAYGDRLPEKRPIKIRHVADWFKRHGKQKVSMLEEENMQQLSGEINTAKDLRKLLDLMNDYLAHYKMTGERLKLKDTINTVLRIHELIAKMKADKGTKAETSKVQQFLMSVQKDLGAPSISKEVEYDEYGNPKKIRVETKGDYSKWPLSNFKKKKKENKEEDEEKEEEIIIEAN